MKFKKTKLLIALCLSGSIGFAQLVTNGGFESYNTLPSSCSTGNTLSDVNSWYESHSAYDKGTTPPYPCLGANSSASVYYYNNSTGGNGSCEPFAAHSGNGFITVAQNGLSSSAGGQVAHYETLYQPISSTLYASKKYLFTTYAYIGSVVSSNYVASNIYAALTTNIGLGGSAPTPTVTGTSGWCLVQSVLTVPSDGSYTLNIASPTPGCNTGPAFYWALDDISLQEFCTADAGPNVNDQNTACCGCTTSGVQIGTTAIGGYTYSWAPSAYISGSSTIAQPTANWCVTNATKKIYTVTVSGTGCATNTSTVQVGTNPFTGTSCCRLANPSAGSELGTTVPTTLNVFPNPAKGNVTINVSDNAEFIRITDMQGRVVYEAKNTDAGELKIDISKFGKGMYFVSAKMGDNIEKQKLIIE